MAWYDRILGREEKLNPIQPYLTERESSREFTQRYELYYEQLEIVNRGVNMIVDDVAEIPCRVMPRMMTDGIVKGVRRTRVERLINVEPNPYQDCSAFKRNLITDYLLDGNIFIYYDGAHLYHLPADGVTIHGDTRTFVEKYSYNDVDYSPSEIIHIKENSFHSIYRGTSRLKPAVRTMALIAAMKRFQDNFFKHGA